jgi:hypothetical protein
MAVDFPQFPVLVGEKPVSAAKSSFVPENPESSSLPGRCEIEKIIRRLAWKMS